MSQTEILGRLYQLKSDFTQWVHHFKDHDEEEKVHPIHLDNYHYESHRIDDSDLVDYRARGIDRFGEDDEVEEGEDQHHSELSDRYYTHGLHDRRH